MNRKPHCDKQRLFTSMRLLLPAVNLSKLQRRLRVLNWESLCSARTECSAVEERARCCTRICVTDSDPDNQKGPDLSKVTAFVGNGLNKSLHSVEPQLFSLANK